MGKPGTELNFLGLSFIHSSLLSVQGKGLTTARYVAEEAKLSVGSGEKRVSPGTLDCRSTEIFSSGSGLKTCTAMYKDRRTIRSYCLRHHNTQGKLYQICMARFW